MLCSYFILSLIKIVFYKLQYSADYLQISVIWASTLKYYVSKMCFGGRNPNSDCLLCHSKHFITCSPSVWFLQESIKRPIWCCVSQGRDPCSALWQRQALCWGLSYALNRGKASCQHGVCLLPWLINSLSSQFSWLPAEIFSQTHIVADETVTFTLKKCNMYIVLRFLMFIQYVSLNFAPPQKPLLFPSNRLIIDIVLQVPSLTSLFLLGCLLKTATHAPHSCTALPLAVYSVQEYFSSLPIFNNASCFFKSPSPVWIL